MPLVRFLFDHIVLTWEASANAFGNIDDRKSLLSILSINIFSEKKHTMNCWEGFYQHECNVLLATTVSECIHSEQSTFFAGFFASIAFDTQCLLAFVHWFWKEHFEFSMNFNLCCFYFGIFFGCSWYASFAFSISLNAFWPYSLSKICAIGDLSK